MLRYWAKDKFRSWNKRLIALFVMLSMLLPDLTTFAEPNGWTTDTQSPVCGYIQHEHTDACYEEVQIPSDDSGTRAQDKNLFSVHHHTADCYDGNGNLTCGLTEGKLYHKHTDSCRDEEGNIICGLAENELYIEPEIRTERQLTCGLEEHIHGPDCYKEAAENVLTADQSETPNNENEIPGDAVSETDQTNDQDDRAAETTTDPADGQTADETKEESESTDKETAAPLTDGTDDTEVTTTDEKAITQATNPETTDTGSAVPEAKASEATETEETTPDHSDTEPTATDKTETETTEPDTTEPETTEPKSEENETDPADAENPGPESVTDKTSTDQTNDQDDHAAETTTDQVDGQTADETKEESESTDKETAAPLTDGADDTEATTTDEKAITQATDPETTDTGSAVPEAKASEATETEETTPDHSDAEPTATDKTETETTEPDTTEPETTEPKSEENETDPADAENPGPESVTDKTSTDPDPVDTNTEKTEPEEIPVFEIREDILIRYNGNGEVVTIPDGIRKIDKKAFYNNKTIVKAILPDSVEIINSSAFAECPNLEQIILSDNSKLGLIGEAAFKNDKKLDTSFAANVDRIVANAFDGINTEAVPEEEQTSKEETDHEDNEEEKDSVDNEEETGNEDSKENKDEITAEDTEPAKNNETAEGEEKPEDEETVGQDELQDEEETPETEPTVPDEQTAQAALTLSSDKDALYQVAITFPAEAGIPEGTELVVAEQAEPQMRLLKTTPKKRALLGPAGAKLLAAEDQSAEETYASIPSLTTWNEGDEAPDIILYQKTLDISLVAGGEEIEPDPGTKVTVSVYLPEIEDGQEVTVRHLTDQGPELLESTNNTGTITFTTDSFSLFEFTSTAQKLSSWTSDLLENTLFGRSGNEEVDHNSITIDENSIPDGFSILEAFSTTQSNNLWLMMQRVKDIALGKLESVSLYAVEDGKLAGIVKENIGITGVLRFNLSNYSSFALVRDSGLRNKVEELGNVILSGLMPKNGVAEAVDVTEEYADFVPSKSVEQGEADEASGIEQGETVGAENGETAHTIAAYDISITNDGEEYQPEDKPIEVTIKDEAIAKAVANGNAISLWHVLDDGTTEQITDFTVSDDILNFSASGFSVYVLTETVVEKILTASDGNVYKITVTYDGNAQIPEGAELVVAEVAEDQYLASAATVLGVGESYLLYRKFLDISFKVTDEAGERKIEPATTVQVKIELLDVNAGADKLQVVHFGKTGAEKVNATANENAVVTFSTGEFSVYGFGNVLEPIDTVETDEASIELLGFGTETQLTATDSPEVEEGLEVFASYSVDNDSRLWIKAELKEGIELTDMESVAVYSVKESNGEDETVKTVEELAGMDTITELPTTEFAVVKDSGYRHLSFNLTPDEEDAEKTVTLDGMMPKNVEAVAVDVSDNYADHEFGVATQPAQDDSEADEAPAKSETEEEQADGAEEAADFSDEAGEDLQSGYEEEVSHTTNRITIAAFDISITNNETDYQPDDEHPVDVTITDDRINSGNSLELWHIKDDGTEERVEEFTIENDTLSFTATGFSTYAITYTVDFFFGDYEFHMAGGDEMLLSDLLRILSIDVDLRNSTATFTNPDVLALSPVEEERIVVDWTLKSIEPFDTEEKLTITLSDRTVIEIRVTDIQVTFDNVYIALKVFEGAEKTAEDEYTWTPGTVASNHPYSFRLNYKINTEASLDYWVPGEVEIKIPRHIMTDENDSFTDSNGNYYDSFEIALAHADDSGLTSANVFVYSFDDNGTPNDESDDFIIVTNRLNVAPTKENYFEFSYLTTKQTFDYEDEAVLGAVKASLTIYDQKKENGITVVDKSRKLLDGTDDANQSNEVSILMDTYAEFQPSVAPTKTAQAKYTDWNSAWGTEPADASDYWYIVWTIKSEIKATQRFDYSLVDQLDASVTGDVVAYRMSEDSNWKMAGADGAGVATNCKPSNSMTMKRTDYVLTRINKTTYSALLDGENAPGIYTIPNNITITVKPEKGNDPSEVKNVSGSFTEKKKSYSAPAGSMTSDKQGKSVSHDLTTLQTGGNTSGLTYDISQVGNTWAWTFSGIDSTDEAEVKNFGKKPVVIETEDSTFYLQYFDYQKYVDDGHTYTETLTNSIIRQYTTAWKNGGDSIAYLQSDDYRIDSVTFSYAFRDAVTKTQNETTGEYEYSVNYDTTEKEFISKSLTEAEIYDCTTQKCWDGTTPRLGDLVFTLYSGSAELGSVSYDFIDPDDANAQHNYTYTGGLSSSNVTIDAKTVYFDPSLNVTGYKLTNKNALYSTTFKTTPSVTLKGAGAITSALLAGITADTSTALTHPYNPEIDLVNTARMSVYYDGESTKLVQASRTADDDIIGNTRSVDFTKSVGEKKNDNLKGVYLINWTVNLKEYYTQAGEKIAVKQRGGTFFDYLPFASELVPDSLEVLADGALLDEGSYSLELDSNKYSTGREKMIIRISKNADSYTIRYQTSTSWDAVLEQRTVDNQTVVAHNAVIYLTGNEDICGANVTASGTWTRGSVNDDKETDRSWATAKLNEPVDRDGWAGQEQRLIGTATETSINALVSGEMGLHKTVRATYNGAVYSSDDLVYTDDEYSYRITFGPEEGQKAYGMVLYDFLENYSFTQNGETHSSAWHGILKNVDISMLQRLGCKPVVYYCTEDRANLTDELMDINNSNIWTTTKPADPTTITGIAVDMRHTDDDPAEDFIVHGGNIVTIKVFMTAPSQESIGDQHIAKGFFNYNSVTLKSKQISETSEASNEDVESTFIHAYTTLRLRTKGVLRIHKVSSENEADVAEGVTFHLSGISAYGTVVDKTATSDEDGQLVFSRLEMTDTEEDGGYGPYILQEVSGIPDYQFDDTIMYVWVYDNGDTIITGTNNEPVSGAVAHAAYVNGELLPDIVSRYDQNADVFYITNKPRAHGDLTFIKMGNVDGGDPIALGGVEFRLSGTSDYGNTIEKYATSYDGTTEEETDESSAERVIGDVCFEDIEKGTYQLEEIYTAEGYISANRSITVNCDALGIVTMSLTTNAFDNVTLTSSVENGEIKYVVTDEPLHKFHLYKRDAVNGATLEGAEFTLTGKSDYDTDVNVTAISSADGVVRFSGLEPGTYVLREVTAPTSYVVDSTAYQVVITNTGAVTISWVDDEGSSCSMTNVVNGTLVTTEGDGSTEDTNTHTADEHFFYGYYGRFNMPNARSEDGIVTITKVWQDENGNPITSGTDGNPIPVVNLFNEEPAQPIMAAMISWSKWNTYVNGLSKDSVTSFGQYDSANPESIDSTWTEIGTGSGIFQGTVYVKVINKKLCWRLGENTGSVYWEDCNAVFCCGNRGDAYTGYNYRSEYTHSCFTSITTIDLQNMRFDFVESTRFMFGNDQNLKNVYFGNDCNTTSLTDMNNMFGDCLHIQSISIGMLDTGLVKDMSAVFRNCKDLTSITGLSSFDTHSATTMSNMFRSCEKITSLDISSFITSNVTSMDGMFQQCNGLTSLDVSRFNTSRVTNMMHMFRNISWNKSSFKILDISNFDTQNVTNMGGMFQNCRNLTTIIVGNNWNTSNVTTWKSTYHKDDGYIFVGCTTNLKGSNGTTWSSSHVDGEYARIDGGPSSSTPGYLTLSANPNTPAAYTGSSLPAPVYPTISNSDKVASTKTTLSVLDSNNTDWTNDNGTWVYMGTKTNSWIYNSNNGQWIYRMPVYDADTAFYVTEDQVDDAGNAYLDPYSWISMDSGEHYQILNYVAEQDNSVTVVNKKKEDSSGGGQGGGDPTPATGSLLITKAVSDEISSSTTFQFQVTIGESTETFTLSPGGSKMYSGLQGNTQYTVKEILTEEYDTPDPITSESDITVQTEGGVTTYNYVISTGNIESGKQTRVTVTNHLKPTTGDLILQKSALANEGVTDLDPDGDYQFVITLLDSNNAPLTGMYGGNEGSWIFDSNGQTTITVKSMNRISLNNLPVGTQYTITESEYAHFSTSYVKTVVDGETTTTDASVESRTATGTIAAGTESTIAYTNTKTENETFVGFNLQKLLGTGTESDAAFNFSISLSSLDAKKAYSYRIITPATYNDSGEILTAEQSTSYSFTASNSGTRTLNVSLYANQIADFSHTTSRLPVGTKYQIREVNNSVCIPTYVITKTDGSAVSDQNTAKATSLSTSLETISANDTDDVYDDVIVYTNTEPIYSLKVLKVDTSDNQISGAVLTLFKLHISDIREDTNHDTIEDGAPDSNFTPRTVTTDGNEWYLTLHQGSYLIEETSVPDGYMKADPVRFDVGGDGSITWWYLESITSDTDSTTNTTTYHYLKDIDEKQKTTNTIRMVDEPFEIKVRKVEADGTYVQGARLRIFKGSGASLDTSTIIDDWSSELSGAHTVSGGLLLYDVNDENEHNEYTLREVHAPTGYGVADDIVFRLLDTSTSSTVSFQLQIYENGSWENCTNNTITMTDSTQFSFSKRWSYAGVNMAWPDGASITVQIERGYIEINPTTYIPVNTTVLGRETVATYTITEDGLASRSIAPSTVSSSTGDNNLYYTSTTETSGILYTFTLRNAKKYGTETINGSVKKVEYIHYVVETDHPATYDVFRFSDPLYYHVGSINNEDYGNDGDIIANVVMIPSPTGVTMRHTPYLLLLLVGIMLMGTMGSGVMRKRKEELVSSQEQETANTGLPGKKNMGSPPQLWKSKHSEGDPITKDAEKHIRWRNSVWVKHTDGGGDAG